MGHSQRPRGGSLPLPMDASINAAAASNSSRRTIAMNLEAVVLDDMDALLSVHRKPLPEPQPQPQPQMPHPFPRRGSTSNCVSRKNPRRRRRRSSATSASTADADADPQDDSEREATETSFFVDDEPVPVLAGSVVRDYASVSDRGTAGSSRIRAYGTPNRPRRSASMPLTAPQSDYAATQTQTSQRRHTTQPTATKPKLRKKVTFKNAYEPVIMPDSRPPVQSYDDLLFNVAGLYHTLSFLHDADYFDDGSATDSSSASSTDSSAHEAPPPPPERSVQLMIAEFLYRSAVYLGYPPDDNVWVPGFREKKKFSSNDVKRWRRLAHFDWAAEERAYAQEEAERHALSRASSRTSSRWTRLSTRTTTTLSRESTTLGLRATVSNWLHMGRTSSRDRSNTTALVPLTKTTTKERPLPTLLVDPPLVPDSTDLSLLVQVANSCISYGAFRFTERQIRKLCNVPIRK